MLDTTIQLRIDAKTKRAAQRRFQMLGLDLSSGVKLMLRQALADDTLAITPTTRKWTDLRHWRLYEKEIARAEKHGKRYRDVDKLLKDLDAD